MSDGISKLVRLVVKVGVPAVPPSISSFTFPSQYSSCRAPETKVVPARTLTDSTASNARSVICFIRRKLLRWLNRRRTVWGAMLFRKLKSFIRFSRFLSTFCCYLFPRKVAVHPCQLAFPVRMQPGCHFFAVNLTPPHSGRGCCPNVD